MKQITMLLLLLMSLTCTAQEIAQVWSRSIGGNGPDFYGKWVNKDKYNNPIVLIHTLSNTSSGSITDYCYSTKWRSIFVKYDPTFTTKIWSKCFEVTAGDSVFFFIDIRSDGYVIGGYYSGTKGVIMQKRDNSDNIVWQRSYSRGASAMPRDFMATEDGGYVVLSDAFRTDTNIAIHYGSTMTEDYWVLRVDSNGYKVWSKVLGGTGYDYPSALCKAPGDGCYVTGAIGSTDYDGSCYKGGGQDNFLARLNKNGELVWRKCLGGSGVDGYMYSGDIYPDNEGGVYVAAMTTSTDGDVHGKTDAGYDYWLVHVDSSGNVLWEQHYNAYGVEYPYSVCQATDGSLWMTGVSEENHKDIYTVHASGIDGSLIGSSIMSSTSSDRGMFVHPVPGGGVVMGGHFDGVDRSFVGYTRVGDDDLVLINYASWNVGTEKINAAENSGLEVYPNPSKGQIKVYIKGNEAMARAEVVDVNGRVVHSCSVPSNVTSQIILPTKVKGVYVLQVSVDGATMSETIIIE